MPAFGLIEFNPKNFSSLVLWLDAANPSNNGTWPSNSSSLTTWVDVSGIAGNAASSGHPPTFKTGIKNGLPGIQFISSSSTCVFIPQTTHLDLTSGFSLFFVSNDTTGLNASPINKRTASFGWQFSTIYGGGALSGLQFCDAANSCVYSGTSYSANTAYLWCVTCSSTATNMYNNGSNIYTQSGNFLPTAVSGTCAIGGVMGTGNFVNGYIHEILLYNAALSSGQQALVNDYLRRKWALF